MPATFPIACIAHQTTPVDPVKMAIFPSLSLEKINTTMDPVVSSFKL
jgi:hypothetical protein